MAEETPTASGVQDLIAKIRDDGVHDAARRGYAERALNVSEGHASQVVDVLGEAVQVGQQLEAPVTGEIGEEPEVGRVERVRWQAHQRGDVGEAGRALVKQRRRQVGAVAMTCRGVQHVEQSVAVVVQP